jgi:succinate-semialdehyde dehydrogenase/glutarate-semialdehyde dehydrogenase
MAESAAYPVRLGLSIGGRWLHGDGRDTHDVLNPATGEALAQVPLATADDLDSALEAAQRGFLAWRTMPATDRAGILRKAAALLRERQDHIARIATMEQGKPLAEAWLEAGYAASLIEFHAGEAERIYGRVLPRPAGMRSLVLQQPVGPVAAFCAWNFPITNVVRKISPALAAGCSIILKPSEEAPGSAVEILRCFHDAGVPGDVVQCVFGVPELVSRQLLASPITRKLSFTGSTVVGKHLLKLASETVMRSTMELGGHAPVLVFDDCDLEKTLDQLTAHKFRNAGQVCISPTRFHVQAGIYDRFAKGLAARAARIRVEDGLGAGAQMGPLANARRREAVEALVEDAQRLGAKTLAGGARGGGAGFFFTPTILSDVPLEARAMAEEPFGPLALLRPFETAEEAIAEANRLAAGLAAYCFTENGRRQNLLADSIEAGMIAINSVQLGWADSPFSGVKESGNGSEDGPEGVAAHLVTKSVHSA